MTTRKTNYISPEVTLLDVEVEQGFGTSQSSPDVNIGIGGGRLMMRIMEEI